MGARVRGGRGDGHRAARHGAALGAGQGADRQDRGQGRRRGAAGALACGAGTDQLADGEPHPLGAIIDAYAEQMAFVQAAGAQVILMASRALAAAARGPRDYLEVTASC